MQHNRRQFLQLTGALGSGFAISSLTGNNPAWWTGEPKRIRSFGIQLYSLRDVIEKDPKQVLKQVASFGYKQIESYEKNGSIFWGMTNTEFKKFMDELGMVLISSHCDIKKDFEKKVNDAAAIGMKYLICPSIDTQQTADDYKRTAEHFNQCGAVCKKAGIRFAYHNHDHDFKLVEGQVVQDIYMQNTNPSLVDFEMDIYWVVTAGHDPEAWLKKYQDRFRLCHIKDRVKDNPKREDSCDLGKGSIDFPEILKTARKNGMQYYIVEQEHYPGSTPLKSIEVDAEYMRNLRF